MALPGLLLAHLGSLGHLLLSGAPAATAGALAKASVSMSPYCLCLYDRKAIKSKDSCGGCCDGR